MRCQHCNQNEATTFIKKNINGHKEEMHLCSECAKELGVMDEFRIPSMSEMFGDSFLGNFLGAKPAAHHLMILSKAAEWDVQIAMINLKISLNLH